MILIQTVSIPSWKKIMIILAVSLEFLIFEVKCRQ